MTDFHQNPVSAAIWPWVTQNGQATATASRRPWAKLAISAVIGGGVGSYLLWRDHQVGACIVYSIVGLIVGSGLLCPPLYRRIERVFQAFGSLVGTALTWILLVPFFFLVFPFAHLCLLLRGNDPLTRKFPTDQPTYWSERKRVEDPQKHFRRQFG